MSRLEYVPLNPPQDGEIETLNRYLQNELQRISEFIGGASQVTLGQMLLTAASDTVIIPATTTVTVIEYDSANVEDDVSADTTAGTLTVLNESNLEGSFSSTISSNLNNTTITYQLYRNGVAVTGTDISYFLKTANEPVTISFSAVGHFERGDEVEARITNNEAGSRTITYSNLTFTLSSV